MPTSPDSLHRWTRWAGIAAAVLMGGALLATVWSSYRGVQRASGTLMRGQADVFLDSLRGRIFRLGPGLTEAQLREVIDDTLQEHRDDGLVYIAAAMPDSARFTLHAGSPNPAPIAFAEAVRTLKPNTQVRVGDRERALLHKPPARAPDGSKRAHSPKPPTILIEFEPKLTDDLEAAARRTLGVGGMAALVFLILAIGLMRWSLRQHERQRALEHERRLASLGEMSAVLAHEIRNPLASLKGNTQLLARALPEGDRLHRKAQRVVAEAIRLENLTNDLLEFVRSGEIERAEVDPQRLLREAVDAVGAERVCIQADHAPASWPMDRERVRQVLTNLLENALHEGDVVYASVRASQHALVFTVRDSGSGIDPDDQERIFEPFFTRRVRGTGLGLAVSRRLIELHGGRLEVTNHPEGGAEFSASLPRAPRR